LRARIPVAAKEPFEALMRAYIEEIRRRRYARASELNARSVLPRLFEHWCSRRVRDVHRVNEADLVAFSAFLKARRNRHGQPLSAWTQSTYLTVVRSFFAFLERQRLILRNPAGVLTIPKGRRLGRVHLNERQAEKLMGTPLPNTPLGIRDRAILELLYGAGVRLSECARLDVHDLDLQEGTLLVRNGKGRKDRVLPIPARAVMAIDRYMREARPELLRHARESALFLACNGWGGALHGARLGSQALQKLVREYARKAGLSGVSTHSLRHAYATHLLRAGASVRHVQALLGHRDIGTTALYTNVTIKDLRDVLARTHPRERKA
jgi:integrase/recombinase XerD